MYKVLARTPFRPRSIRPRVRPPSAAPAGGIVVVIARANEASPRARSDHARMRAIMCICIVPLRVEIVGNRKSLKLEPNAPVGRGADSESKGRDHQPPVPGTRRGRGWRSVPAAYHVYGMALAAETMESGRAWDRDGGRR